MKNVPRPLTEGDWDRTGACPPVPRVPAVLSFDVEEHHRIEAAHGVEVSSTHQEHYLKRMEESTRWLLDELQAGGVRATFFILGQIARELPGLVRAVHEAGHEVASHGWDHRRLHQLTPKTFSRGPSA